MLDVIDRRVKRARSTGSGDDTRRPHSDSPAVATPGPIIGRCLAIAAAIVPYALLGACGDDDKSASSTAPSGRAAYEATCAACHGEDLRGTATGPPFLDVVYAPNHHPDDSFRAAVARGVQPHHWNFGPMPPQPHISDDEIDAIIAYVRDRQRDAGITEDPSH